MTLSRTAIIASSSHARFALGILHQLVACMLYFVVKEGTCTLHSLLFGAAGVVFGWPSLQRILESEGVFVQKCPGVSVIDCNAAAIKYNTIFTAGAFGATGGSLLFGLLFDRYGPRVSSIFGHIMMIMGVLMFAFSSNSCKYTVVARHSLSKLYSAQCSSG